MKTIILDTDFLVFCAETLLDYETELKRICDFPFTITVLDKTIEEFSHVAAKSKPKEHAVKLAKTILAKKNTHIMPTPPARTADELILQTVTSDYCVATQDRVLKRKLHAKGIIVITARQEKYLVIE